MRSAQTLSVLVAFGAFLVPPFVTGDQGDVTLNEILYNADPTNDGGEFVELFN